MHGTVSAITLFGASVKRELTVNSGVERCYLQEGDRVSIIK